jgi:hypothetical protein
MKKGLVEDLDTAIDLQKMAFVIDRIGELFEEEGLTADEAVWAAALSYLSTFNATDQFANTELLNSAARALLREAGDVFDSLPEPGTEGELEEGELEEGEPEKEEEEDLPEQPEEEREEAWHEDENAEPESTEIPHAGG